MSDFPIFNVIVDLPEYNTGESVGLSVIFSYTGTPRVIPIKIFNRDTGKQLDSFGLFVMTGEHKVLHRTILMPEGNLPLSVHIDGERANRDIQNLDAPPIPPEPEEIIEDPPEEIPPEGDPTIFGLPPREEPPEYEPTSYNIPSLPWYVGWLEPLSSFFGLLVEGASNHFTDTLAPLFHFFTDPVGAVTKKFNTLFTEGTAESIKSSLDITSLMGEGSPDWLVDLRGNIDKLVSPMLEEYTKATDVKTYEESILSPEEASKKLNEMRTALITPSIALFGIHAGIESASLGQFEWFKEIEPMILSKFGLTSIIQRATLLPIEKAILIPAEQHYNYIYTPLIPAYADLIQMVVKEKITIPEFKMYMRLQGFSADFSQKIWDSHFIAPSLGQLLTTFRRGKLTEDELVKLQILVDLDPLYNEIWKDQWYHDPTPRQSRWMFEAGAIDEARVKDIVVRSGLLPEDVDAFTEYLITFNERQWKRRYIIEVAKGYRLGTVLEPELRKEVERVYFSKEIANWIVETENIAIRPVPIEVKPDKVKLIGLGEWKKGYLLDKVTEDELRSELTDRNYEELEINLLIAILDEDKIARSEGTKIVRLTKGEILQAFKQNELDEDDILSRLMDMGLDQLEAQLLIDTKKKQWGLE